MRNFYLTASLASILLLSGGSASAQTFVANDLTFEITSETTCSFTSLEEDFIDILEIPASVTYEGNYYTVTAIGDGACRDKEELLEVTIPATVTTIGKYAFYGDREMTTLTIGEGVTNIDTQAFDICNSLTKITVLAPNPPKTAQGTVFSSVTTGKATLYVPEESMEDYKFPFYVWADFAKMKAIGDEEPEEPEPVDPTPEEPEGLKMTAISPANGAARHSLNVFLVSFELLKTEEENHLIIPQSGAAGAITLTREGAEPIHPTSVRPVDNFPVTTVAITFPYQNEEGEYTLTIPAGVIAKCKYNPENGQNVPVEGATNSEITATYTVSADVPTIFSDYTLSPASGKTVASIYEIGLTFNKAPYALDIDESLPIMLTNGTETYTGVIGGWGNERRLTFDSESERYVTITEQGTWTLTIPSGVFAASGESNDEITAVYTIADDIDFAYNCTPLNLSKMELPEDSAPIISFTFEDVTDVSLKPFITEPEASFTVKYGDTELKRVNNAIAQSGYQPYVYEGDPTLYIRINRNIFSEPGILTIEAEKGAFTVDGLASPAISYALNYAVDRTFSFEVTPQAGIKSDDLSRFTVAFPDATEARFFPEEAFVVLFMVHNSCTEYTVTEIEDAEYPTFEIVFDPAPTVYGEYSFTIDTRSFLLDKYFFNPIITGKYTLADPEEIETGIEETEYTGATETADIYSIDGTLVIKAATEQQIGSLAPGIYISNGRKVIVK